LSFFGKWDYFDEDIKIKYGLHFFLLMLLIKHGIIFMYQRRGNNFMHVKSIMKTGVIGAEQAMFAIYNGTSLAIYYLLSAVALLLFTYVMFSNNIFSKTSGYVGLLAGMLMLVPPAPVIGRIEITSSVLPLVPWAVWLILFAGRLLKLSD
jgi:hypothetical protein